MYDSDDVHQCSRSKSKKKKTKLERVDELVYELKNMEQHTQTSSIVYGQRLLKHRTIQALITHPLAHFSKIRVENKHTTIYTWHQWCTNPPESCSAKVNVHTTDKRAT